MTSEDATVHLGPGFTGVDSVARDLVALRFASRLMVEDATLWGPKAQQEAAVRLGWVSALTHAEETVAAAEDARIELRSRGITRIVLAGMGGSSLAPELLSKAHGAALTVLDSTHPDQVRRAVGTELHHTLLIVASKSGSTLETLSHKAILEREFAAQGVDPRDHLAVISDPGSPLAESAAAAGMRVFLADPHVGGRFSALTAFGLVPAVLAGVDVTTLLADARSMRARVAEDSVDNPAIRLAAALTANLPQRFAVMLATHPQGAPRIGEWVEQLVAESTGKDHRGLLPVPLTEHSPELGETLPQTALRLWLPSAPNRELEAYELAVDAPLGGQLFLWETATAMVGALLRVSPFDQPDVESTKQATRGLLAASGADPRPETPYRDAPAVHIGQASVDEAPSLAEQVRQLISQLEPEGYFAIQAYVDRESDRAELFAELRDELARSVDVPVTLGFGPRFLHSTGQFHKGGPATGVFLQLRDVPAEDLAVPGSEHTLSTLLNAQADGDADVLLSLGRPVLQLRALEVSETLSVISKAAAPETPREN